MRLLVLLVSVALAATTGASAVEPVRFDLPHGDGHLKAVLYRPDGVGPFPSVVGLHGCGGLNNRAGAIGTRYDDWGKRLVQAGFAVLFPDSYGSRGLASQCGQGARSVRTNRERVADADAARLWLQSQPWVTPNRVSLLGWSDGGITTLWAVRTRVAPKGGADFRSAVALYPGCRRLGNTAWSARVPTLILIGRLDEQTSASACEQMVAGARGRSARVAIQVYAGAHHDFDHPNRALQVRSGYAFSVDGTGRIRSGTNSAARADALRRVPEWLSR
jgi:dienelactone hydrolase